MSVVVKNLEDNKFRIHVKGSPEKLRELCRPESIPAAFHKILDHYAKNGFRVLACGTKSLSMSYREIQKVERDGFEFDLTFMGFIIMENKLKPITTSIIDILQEAHVRTIMVTGDNVLTAISVARQCHIVRANQRIFLGELTEPRNGMREAVKWSDFEMSDHILNPENLKPIDEIVDNPDVDETVAPFRYRSEFRADNKHRNEEERADETRDPAISLSEIQPDRPEKHPSIRASNKSVREARNTLISKRLMATAAEDQLPWQSDENFVLAVTGKA